MEEFKADLFFVCFGRSMIKGEVVSTRQMDPYKVLVCCKKCVA